MTVQITDAFEVESTKGATFTCGKVEAFVTRSDYGKSEIWRVCALNSSHATWRGAGKGFASHEAALAGYKSGAMKAILMAARDALV